jgi:hypothetical protein
MSAESAALFERLQPLLSALKEHTTPEQIRSAMTDVLQAENTDNVPTNTYEILSFLYYLRRELWSL